MALTPADLQAAEVDVAMLGAGVDTSAGMRGASFGARALRAHDMNLPTVAMGLTHQHTRVDAFEELVGGDHSLMYPDVAAMADVYRKGRIGVIHFDAHFDASSFFIGHNHAHGTPYAASSNRATSTATTSSRAGCAAPSPPTTTWP